MKGIKEKKARNVLRASEIVECFKREGIDVELVMLDVNSISFKVESPRRLGEMIEQLFEKWPDVERVSQHVVAGLGKVVMVGFEREKETSIP